MTTVAQDVRDDLIAQDIRVRRVSARLERDIEVRLKRMELDLADLVIKTDAKVTKAAAKEIIDAAYADVDAMVLEVAQRLAAAEAKAVVKAIKKALP